MTLQFDEASAAYFERRRQAHFPAAINRTPAHLTLFHQLPGEALQSVLLELGKASVGQPPFPAAVTGLMRLGRGVAYAISSPQLIVLRQTLARAFKPMLTAQDRQGFRPHVTVQNKVAREDAERTLFDLQSSFEPFEAIAEGLQLWHYRGGPWSAIAAVPFGGPRADEG